MPAPKTLVHGGIALWSGGDPAAGLDVWFHPAFGDSRAAYRAAFTSVLARHARLFAFDPPGHGASRPRRGGLTVASCASIWRALIARHSGTRDVVLVGHSMAGLVASRTAWGLGRQAALVISVEGNLTRADACFTGLAAEFESPSLFRRALQARLRGLGRDNAAVRSFGWRVGRSDPLTLWTLGRSVAAVSEPGAAFRRLRCPKLHYWDAIAATAATRDYVTRHGLPQRRLDGLGHWPMLEDPRAFYEAVLADIRSVR